MVFQFAYGMWSDVAFSHFPAVYGMLLPEGFIRRKGINTLRINQQTENCYKTSKIGRSSIICSPKETEFDGQNFLFYE